MKRRGRGLVGWFPQRWRSRYGSEFAALLEELHEDGELTPRMALDVLRSGLLLHRDDGRSRRRFFIGGICVALASSGLALALTFGSGPAKIHFAKPTALASVAITGSFNSGDCPWAPMVNSGLPARAGEPVGGTFEAAFGPTEDEKVGAGTADGLGWTVYSRVGSLLARSDVLDRIEDGGLVLNGRWYSLCASLPRPIQAGPLFGPNGVIGWAGAFHVVDAVPDTVVYGFVPASTTSLLVTSSAGKRAKATLWRVGKSGASLFIARLDHRACSLRWVENTTSGVSPTGLGEAGYLAADTYTGISPKCVKYRLVESAPTPGTVPSRTSGMVSSIGTNSFVMASAIWGTTTVKVGPGTTFSIPGDRPAAFSSVVTGERVRLTANVSNPGSSSPTISAAGVSVVTAGEYFAPIDGQQLASGPVSISSSNANKTAGDATSSPIQAENGASALEAFAGTVTSVGPEGFVIDTGKASRTIEVVPTTVYSAPVPSMTLGQLDLFENVTVAGPIVGSTIEASSVEVAYGTTATQPITSIGGLIESIQKHSFIIGYDRGSVVVQTDPTTRYSFGMLPKPYSFKSLKVGESVNVGLKPGSSVIATFVNISPY